MVTSSTYLLPIISLSTIAEMIGTMAPKYSYGFSKLIPSLLTMFFYITAILLMSVAAISFDISTIYSIWATGSGALIYIGGSILFYEPITLHKLLGILSSALGIFFLAKGENI